MTDGEQQPDIDVRIARETDHHGIADVARAHEFTEADSGVDERYLSFLARHGHLVVAVSTGARDGDEVVGFGGAVEAGGVRVVSDLFVLESHQGCGIGARMLSMLVEGADASMTFSTDHPRALPAYERAEMHPRWRLDYWRGTVPAVAGEPSLDVVEVSPGAWLGDRVDLVQHWTARGGRLVHLEADGRLMGWSIVNPPGEDEHEWSIDRLVTHGSHRVAMGAMLAWLPSGVEVRVVVPEHSEAAAVLRDSGFVVVDHDRCCTTDGTDVAPQVVALHPGLG